MSHWRRSRQIATCVEAPGLTWRLRVHKHHRPPPSCPAEIVQARSRPLYGDGDARVRDRRARSSGGSYRGECAEAGLPVVLGGRGDDALDAGVRRTSAASRDHVVDLAGGAGELDLDAAVATIAHPAAQAARRRLTTALSGVESADRRFSEGSRARGRSCWPAGCPSARTCA